MAYEIGQKVIYISLTGTKKEVIILKRKVDFKNEIIDTFNDKGGQFDYLVEDCNEIGKEPFFCIEKELN